MLDTFRSWLEEFVPFFPSFVVLLMANTFTVKFSMSNWMWHQGILINIQLSLLWPSVLVVILLVTHIRATIPTAKPCIMLISSIILGICLTSAHCIPLYRMEQVCVRTSNPVPDRPICMVSNCMLESSTTCPSKAMWFRTLHVMLLVVVTPVLALDLLALFQVSWLVLVPLEMALASTRVWIVKIFGQEWGVGVGKW